MDLLIVFALSFVCIVTAQPCLKDRVSSVTIQNYDGPIYVATPCPQKCENHCSQLYHVTNNQNRCDCDCTCVSQNNVPAQTGCIPQVTCSQCACIGSQSQGSCQNAYSQSQVPCCKTSYTQSQLPCCQSAGCLQGTLSLQGTYMAWQGTGASPSYYGTSCQDRDVWPQIIDLSSLPLHSQCANQICQCGMKRSGYY